MNFNINISLPSPAEDYQSDGIDFANAYKRIVQDNGEFPDLPNAIEIDNIVENIEYLLDTEVFMDSVPTFDGSDNFVPANMDIIKHSVFTQKTEDKSQSFDFSVPLFLDKVAFKPRLIVPPTEDNQVNQVSNFGTETHTISPRSFRTNTPLILTPRSPNANAYMYPIYSPRSQSEHGIEIIESCSPIPEISEFDGMEHTKQIWEVWDSVKMSDIISKTLTITQLVHFDLIQRLISDQNGSRYLQRLLKKSQNKSEVLLMIQYCINKLDLVELSEDVYGNYIVQLFFMKTNEAQHKLLLDTFVNANFLRLSKSMYGCRVIQKCLLCVKNVDYLCEMVTCFAQQTTAANAKAKDSLNEKLKQCLICPYTNHVIQAIFDLKLDCKYIDFIKRELEKNLCYYSEHIIGCRIIQCFIKNYGDKLNILKLICNDNHLYLSKLKYGNYVIQCIISENKWYSDLESIAIFTNKLIEDVFHHQNILYLSKNKFASNVVESCIKVSNRKQKLYLLKVLSSNHYIIPSMINHCYGNYVIKALLNELDTTHKLAFIKTIKFCCSSDIIKKDLVKEMNRIEKEAQSKHSK